MLLNLDLGLFLRLVESSLAAPHVTHRLYELCIHLLRIPQGFLGVCEVFFLFLLNFFGPDLNRLFFSKQIDLRLKLLGVLKILDSSSTSLSLALIAVSFV